MDSPFDLFPTTPYIFLELDQTVDGNVIKSETESEGIVKLRSGMRQTGYGEIAESTTTVHIKPSETFIPDSGLIGHGIRIDGVDHRIIGSVEGKDFDTGEVVFHKVTLKHEELAKWQNPESFLPLS